eukprot:213158-Karenia_brevis.AAC.1
MQFVPFASLAHASSSPESLSSGVSDERFHAVISVPQLAGRKIRSHGGDHSKPCSSLLGLGISGPNHGPLQFGWRCPPCHALGHRVHSRINSDVSVGQGSPITLEAAPICSCFDVCWHPHNIVSFYAAQQRAPCPAIQSSRRVRPCDATLLLPFDGLAIRDELAPRVNDFRGLQ